MTAFLQRCHLTWACSQRYDCITTVSWCSATAPPREAQSPSSGTPTATDSTLLWAQWGQTLAAPTATTSSSTNYRRCLTRAQMWCSCCRYVVAWLWKCTHNRHVWHTIIHLHDMYAILTRIDKSHVGTLVLVSAIFSISCPIIMYICFLVNLTFPFLFFRCCLIHRPPWMQLISYQQCPCWAWPSAPTQPTNASPYYPSHPHTSAWPFETSTALTSTAAAVAWSPSETEPTVFLTTLRLWKVSTLPQDSRYVRHGGKAVVSVSTLYLGKEISSAICSFYTQSENVTMCWTELTWKPNWPG